jgi:hypothetical protein
VETLPRAASEKKGHSNLAALPDNAAPTLGALQPAHLWRNIELRFNFAVTSTCCSCRVRAPRIPSPGCIKHTVSCRICKFCHQINGCLLLPSEGIAENHTL